MNITMVTSNDPAGTAIHFAHLLERFTQHRCRLVTTEIRYNFHYEKDLHVPWLRDFDELEHALKDADVFHFHMAADEHMPLGPFRVRDFLRGQPIVHHHHGEPPFRADPRVFAEREQAAGRFAVVSTPDLLRGYPEAAWVPNGVPLDDPAYRPLAPRDRGLVTVVQSPTRRDLKDTALLEATVASLASRVPELRLELIEMTSHRDCLARKQRAQIAFDHLQGYYGVSSLETLSQGIPTLAGLDAFCLDHIRAFSGAAEVPWVHVPHPEALAPALERLARDAGERAERGRASRTWMERHWSEERVAGALAAVYDEL